jgi:hypothetical protein
MLRRINKKRFFVPTESSAVSFTFGVRGDKLSPTLPTGLHCSELFPSIKLKPNKNRRATAAEWDLMDSGVDVFEEQQVNGRSEVKQSTFHN